jgi:hypothetical protein
MWALGALFVAGCAETEKATTDCLYGKIRA